MRARAAPTTAVERWLLGAPRPTGPLLYLLYQYKSTTKAGSSMRRARQVFLLDALYLLYQYKSTNAGSSVRRGRQVFYFTCFTSTKVPNTET
jgi:hypothetical protein